MSQSISIVILAAGKGTRMYSSLPKVLHPLAGKSLLEHVYHTAHALEHRDIYVIYGFGGEQVREHCKDLFINWIEQKEQKGTGHAVQQVGDQLPDEDLVLILYGDVPLTTEETLKRLISAGRETGFSLLTVELGNPTGYGRIIRNSEGAVTRIVEEKDATDAEKAVTEINTGMMMIDAGKLKGWLSRLNSDNAQGEYYLTDVIEMAVEEGVVINTVFPDSEIEVSGINNRVQLAEMERYYQYVQANQLLQQGVTLMDPARFDLRGEMEIGRDVSIDINCVFEGKVQIGDNVSIGPNSVIKDSVIGDGVEIKANCVIEGASVGVDSKIGPFARLRPETTLIENAHIGNFVEVKKSRIEKGSKVNHLSYIGDSDIGQNVNIGAGTITCNYDGANKHKTVIGDNVFVGSDSQLVAPVKIGAEATIGAGTTITKDVEPCELVISRTRQQTIRGWKRPVKDKK